MEGDDESLYCHGNLIIPLIKRGMMSDYVRVEQDGKGTVPILLTNPIRTLLRKGSKNSNLFEVTIRVLGSLVSMATLTKDNLYVLKAVSSFAMTDQ